MRAALFILCLVGLATSLLPHSRAHRPSSLLGRPYSMKRNPATYTSPFPLHHAWTRRTRRVEARAIDEFRL
ncbi:hypothetical protein EDB89DRAFT_1961218 [Lactarius sanguifluus]|nr:hypothetical protein EDB89DRAFT_1961218 [Lactarius sanguifluus]